MSEAPGKTKAAEEVVHLRRLIAVICESVGGEIKVDRLALEAARVNGQLFIRDSKTTAEWVFSYFTKPAK